MISPSCFRFPNVLLTANVVEWCPALPNGSGDIAGLQLQGDPPTSAKAVRFATAEDVWDHTFRAFGFPAGHDNGVWATGRLLGRQATNWVMIEDVKAQGFAVAAGFSGTPVWDVQAQGVIGMVVAASRPTETRTAFIIPTDVLAAFWPLLTVPQGQPRNPYKGLLPFTQHDAADFFGREAAVKQAIELVGSLVRAQPVRSSTRLLTILGPSGAGKSSLVMAGILPQLQQGALPGSTAWVYPNSMIPGKHPIEALASILKPYFPNTSFKTLRKDLEEETARGLHLLAAQLVTPPGNKVVLLIDQREELFTQTESEDERRHFLRLLLTACSEPRGSVVVLITLRADFYDRTMQYPELYRLIEAQHLSLLALEPDDLRRVIEQPAALPDVHLTFEGDLVNRLLFDVVGQMGALPLLQFTLDQLFQRRNGCQLTLSAYRELGGVKGALTSQVEEIYAALPSDAHRKLTRALFMRLIDPGTTEQDTTRRRAPQQEFHLLDTDQTRLLQELVDIFIAARLLSTNEIAGTTTLEISHEALIRQWPRLAGWLREARQDIPLQQAISQDAAGWVQRGKPKDRLYRGSQLKEAQAWATRSLPSEYEAAFLQASSMQHRRSRVGMMATVLLVLLLSLPAGALLRSFLFSNVVTTLSDNGPGSLRQIVATASPGSTITFSSGLRGTISLTSNDLIITKDLTICGPGADQISISSGKSNHSIRVLQSASVTIAALAFKGSRMSSSLIENEGGMLTLNDSIVSDNTAQSSDGGGIYNASNGTLILNSSIVSDNTTLQSGGGIYNASGKLTLNNSTVSGNTADNGGGGIDGFEGMLTVNNSTISDNTAQSNNGGGISNYGTLMVCNSTIADNRALQGAGDGIVISGLQNSQIILLYCTVYGNTASSSAGGVMNSTVAPGPVTIQHPVFGIIPVTIGASIIAGNRARTDPDIIGSFKTLGYNLVGDRSGTTFLGSPKLQSTDVLGVPPADLKIDPVLRDNGGSVQPHTRTLALLPGSPAIDVVPLQYCQVKEIFNNQSRIYTDQRGRQRPGPGKERCDSGAYESSYAG